MENAKIMPAYTGNEKVVLYNFLTLDVRHFAVKRSGRANHVEIFSFGNWLKVSRSSSVSSIVSFIYFLTHTDEI